MKKIQTRHVICHFPKTCNVQHLTYEKYLELLLSSREEKTIESSLDFFQVD